MLFLPKVFLLLPPAPSSWGGSPHLSYSTRSHRSPCFLGRSALSELQSGAGAPSSKGPAMLPLPSRPQPGPPAHPMLCTAWPRLGWWPLSPVAPGDSVFHRLHSSFLTLFRVLLSTCTLRDESAWARLVHSAPQKRLFWHHRLTEMPEPTYRTMLPGSRASKILVFTGLLIMSEIQAIKRLKLNKEMF